MSDLANKGAVITVGNSGIGLAAARELIRHGAKVVIFGRDEATLRTALGELGAEAHAVRGDVTQLADLDRLFRETTERFGQVDILFANAGVAKLAPFSLTDEALFDQNVDINFKGAFFTAQKALPYLNDGACIIFNTTVFNVKGYANTSVYSAAKAALRSLVRTLAAELAPRGIRVNAVAPGPIETPIYGKLGVPAEAVTELADFFQEAIPLKRFGRVSEIGTVVRFLASAEASFINGVELAVDGGLAQV